MAGGSWEVSLVGALVALNPIYPGFVLAFPNSRTGFFLLSHKKKILYINMNGKKNSSSILSCHGSFSRDILLLAVHLTLGNKTIIFIVLL